MKRAYEYEHTVSFQETNVVGNVYFAHLIGWQGRCREMFLRDHCPRLLERDPELALVTMRTECTYLAELFAFDRILVRMYLDELVRTRFTMSFEYVREGEFGDAVVARGSQQVACMRRTGENARPTAVPEPLVTALDAYRSRESKRRPEVPS